jgi:proteasome component ECM29
MFETDLNQIAIREAKRQNATYRQHSVKALGQIALARVDINLSATVCEIVSPLVAIDTDDDAMDVDSGQPQNSTDL